MEDETGSIEVGKLADLALVEGLAEVDEDIGGARVTMTVLNGEIVWNGTHR